MRISRKRRLFMENCLILGVKFGKRASREMDSCAFVRYPG